MQCPNCRGSIDPNERYCGHCGVEIEASIPTQLSQRQVQGVDTQAPTIPTRATGGALSQDSGRRAALAGLVIGIAEVLYSLAVFVGGIASRHIAGSRLVVIAFFVFFPLAIVGLVASIIGLRSVSRKRLAVIGVVLFGISVVVTLSALAVFPAIYYSPS